MSKPTELGVLLSCGLKCGRGLLIACTDCVMLVDGFDVAKFLRLF